MSGYGYTSRDATLKKTASPNTAGTAGTTQTGAIDLGARSEIGVRSERFELEISIPAMTTTHLPANTSATFTLESSNDSAFATSTEEKKWTFPGETAVSAKTERFKPVLSSNRYWRVKCATTGTTGTGIDGLIYSIEYVC